MKRLRVAIDPDLSWAAGLFEGEGTITIGVRKSDETYRLLCSITMTDQQIIRWFVERWGGWFQEYAERPPRRRYFVWTVAGPWAEAFARDIQPHLRSERVQEKFALAFVFRSLQGPPGRASDRPAQRAVYGRFRELNQRGVSV